MRLTITPKGEQVLDFHYQPDYSVPVALIAGTVVSFLNSEQNILVLSLIKWLLIPLATYTLLTKHKYTTTIDKLAGVISYYQDGILGTSWGKFSSEHSVTEIQSLEIKRHRYRRYLWLMNDFQILLAFGVGPRIELSGSDLSFTESYSASEKIRQFLGSDIPLKAID